MTSELAVSRSPWSRTLRRRAEPLVNAHDEASIPFGKYELLERIGSGGMAEVYRARMTGAHGFEKIVVVSSCFESANWCACEGGGVNDGGGGERRAWWRCRRWRRTVGGRAHLVEEILEDGAAVAHRCELHRLPRLASVEVDGLLLADAVDHQ